MTQIFLSPLGNTRKALELFQLSAAQGYAPVMLNLRSLHAHGDGVPRDDVRAYALIITAIEMGIPENIRAVAPYELGALTLRHFAAASTRSTGSVQL